MFIKRGVVDTPEALRVVYLAGVNRIAWQRRYYLHVPVGREKDRFLLVNIQRHLIDF